MNKTFSIITIILIGCFLANNAVGAISEWPYSVKSGDWSDTLTWDTSSVPIVTSGVRIEPGHAVDISGAGTAGRLMVGNYWYPGISVLNINSGTTLFLDGDYYNGVSFSIGYYSNYPTYNTAPGFGIVNMAGGTVTSKVYTYVGDNADGILNISGGLLQSTDILYGNFVICYKGNGSVYQTGGTVDIAKDFYLLGAGWQGEHVGKYIISGNSTLIARDGWHEIGHYGDSEFRIIGSEPSVTFSGIEFMVNTQGEPNDTHCVLGFELDPNSVNPIGVSPIIADVDDVGIGRNTIFDISGGENGQTALLIDASTAGNPISIDLNKVIVTDPAHYRLRLSANEKQLFVDVIAPVCTVDMPGDFNKDCTVDGQDLLVMIGDWLNNALP